MKNKKKQSFGTGWVTTDEDERKLRRMRAELHAKVDCGVRSIIAKIVNDPLGHVVPAMV